MTLKKIKTAAKDIVEDHSRNIMMFGLEETERENLDHKVKDIFQELKKKLLFRAEIFGAKTSENSERPVKVSIDSSINQLLYLRHSKEIQGFETIGFQSCSSKT